jgi:hypothetical protein
VRSNQALSALAAAIALAAAPAAADTPQALASRVERALAMGEIDALRATVHDLDRAPAMDQAFTLSIVADCSGVRVCSVAVQPIDRDLEAAMEQERASQGLEMPKAEGFLDIVGRRPGEPATAEGDYGRRLWFARVADQYRIVVPRHSASKLAHLRGLTPQAAAEPVLAEGMTDAGTGASDPNWRKKAKPLPADGGAPGAAFLEQVRATAAAVKTDDVEAAARALGEWGRQVFARTDREGVEIPLAVRQRKLRAESGRLLVAARVLGGYQLGDRAVLIVDGTNGLGSAVRGGQSMRLVDGRWEPFNQGLLIEIPRAR